MDDRLEAQDALAFGVALEGQLAEVQLEHRQAIHRSLERDRDPRRALAGARPQVSALGAEDGSDLAQAQPRPVAIDQILEHLLHLTPDREEQIAAVLDLIDRVGVPEAGALLLVQAQAEAEAGGVDPAVADLAQVPACPRIGHGVCNLRQLHGAVDLGETVVLFREAESLFRPLGGDVLVAVQDDLRPERWMPGQLDGQVAPLGVHDVEGVVVDEGLLLRQIPDRPVRRPLHVPDRSDRACHQNQEDAPHARVLAQVLLGKLMLALSGLAVDHRNPVRVRERTDATAEASRQPHQVGGVQVRIRATHQPTPPGPEAAGRRAQRVVGVEDQPIHAIVGAIEQVAVRGAEFVAHASSVRRDPTALQRPAGPCVLSAVSERT